MANADLKVVKVFTQGNKQIGYEVMRVDGSIIKVDRDQMVQAISLGHKYANATVSSSGVVRVSSDVPREDISVTAKKPTGILDYKGDITGFLKDGKTVNVSATWNYLVKVYDSDSGNRLLKTKYIPSGVVDKSINRELSKTYIDPAKAYKKYTFHVSVAEVKKYGHPVLIPKIDKFRDEHETDKTITFWATDSSYTSWFDSDIYQDYDTITIWIYVLNIIPNLGAAESMAYLSMFNDVLDTMQSRLDDGCPLCRFVTTGGNVTSIEWYPFEIKDDTMIFNDERIYKKYIATVARYTNIVQFVKNRGY